MGRPKLDTGLQGCPVGEKDSLCCLCWWHFCWYRVEYCWPPLLQRHTADLHSPYSPPRGPFLQSCFPESGPQSVLWPRVSPPQMQTCACFCWTWWGSCKPVSPACWRTSEPSSVMSAHPTWGLCAHLLRVLCVTSPTWLRHHQSHIDPWRFPPSYWLHTELRTTNHVFACSIFSLTF